MKDTFFELVSRYTSVPSTTNTLWQELEKAYTQKKRHYHTLTHIENLLLLATEHQPEVDDWETLVFAIFYHDAVYNVLFSDNEEKSALLARKRLTQIQFPENRIAACEKLILATKNHVEQQDPDASFFMDADLSILGAPWETYRKYAEQVRKEYAIYPDLVYKPGRKKVLEKFLERPFIFKTPDFKARFEAQARQNLQQELDGV